MSTLRVSHIEAKADPSSPTVDEKIKITNSGGDVLLQLDGATSGITTVGINTTTTTFKVDEGQNVEFVGIVTATVLSATTGKFSGVVTYEDVTNVDSLGIITARSGLNVTGGDFKVGTAVTISNTGIVTAAAFYGDAANLTNLPASAPVGTGTDRAFFLNDKVILSSYEIPAEKNAGTFGPVQVAAAKTVTIPSGSVWTIV